MSKKIRVAWEDLQPGDLIHVKGSTNVYQFIRFTENKCQAEVGTSGVCAGWGGRKVRDNEGKVRYWFETGPTAMLVVSLLGFAYATRPAPKKIGLAGYYMPFDSGEYWLKTSFGWCSLRCYRMGKLWTTFQSGRKYRFYCHIYPAGRRSVRDCIIFGAGNCEI